MFQRQDGSAGENSARKHTKRPKLGGQSTYLLLMNVCKDEGLCAHLVLGAACVSAGLGVALYSGPRHTKSRLVRACFSKRTSPTPREPLHATQPHQMHLDQMKLVHSLIDCVQPIRESTVQQLRLDAARERSLWWRHESARPAMRPLRHLLTTLLVSLAAVHVGTPPMCAETRFCLMSWAARA